MSSPPPTKPPRGVKQGKETSGLLMSVIRTLSASETNEQREKERAKLEKEYKKSDARLDELVAAHASEILEVMHKFTAAGAALNSWGQHCDAAVARLSTCQNLLQLRRDDLRRLWTDCRTHHYALQMLTDIERVVTSEREARAALSAGLVLSCAATLRAAAKPDAARAHALTATRDRLESRRQELVDVIVKRLNHQVYHSGTHVGSLRPSAALILAELSKTEEVSDSYLQDITPEYEASLAEEDKNFENTAMIALEALGVLDQHKEATEKFKCQIQSELIEVIDSVSKRIISEVDVDECEQDSDMQTDEGETEKGRPLARLLAALEEEFRDCATRHKRLLQLWRAALQKHKIPDSCLHNRNHYWGAVQQVMQLLLTEYLEIESVTLAAQRSSLSGPEPSHSLRLADYFAKKKVQKRTKLFRFTGAAPSALPPPLALRWVRVCAPNARRLYEALPRLHSLCSHIENVLGTHECSLRVFVADYVRCGEAARLLADARAALGPALARHAPTERTQGDASHPQIYSWAASAWAAVVGAAKGAKACAAFGANGAARAPLLALHDAAAHARKAYSERIGDGRAQRWLADDDIVRFLKSLPNWRAATSNEPISEDRQFAQELQQAYAREAEILGSSLGDGAPRRRDLAREPAALHHAALLCETMNWQSANVRSLPALSGAKATDKFAAEAEACAQIFDDIAHKCLLYLHLELRIQCFHYLGSASGAEAEAEAEGAAGAEEGAGGAARLAHSLLRFHEQAHNVLNPRRMAYIMNGLGEMMSAGIIWRWQSGANAVTLGSSAPLAALRHCLAALHLDHAGLHSATIYAALLDSEPEQIIQSIKEKGPQFSELEYLNAFKAIAARRALPPQRARALLAQLSSALGHTGVTV